MTLQFFNTLSRRKEAFRPIAPPKVGLYTCGPTVYGRQHLGNYRTYIFEDLLKRVLVLNGFEARHVMNITDVGHLTSQADEGEDKMEVGSRREGKSAWDIARLYTDAFLADCRALRILPPDILCRATEHLPEQVALIERLDRKGFLYRTSDGLYYDTSRFKDYGKLAGGRAAAPARARVEYNPEKKSPSDFAVWKFSPKDVKRQMEWPSPWGIGFPGWHIECSAMSMKYLGESFDIHCGGVDHIPIHHTNEIAQSEGATGKPFVRYWLHGEFLITDAGKMAKSAGGGVNMEELEARGFSPLDFRYHVFTAHYRRQLEFTWESLESSKTARRRLREMARALRGAPDKPACADYDTAFKAHLADDLNAPEALASLWECLRREDLPPGSRLTMAELAEKVFDLGLLEEEQSSPLSPELQRLFEDYRTARVKKNFATSDRLRQDLLDKGIRVFETRDGSKWERA